MDGSPQRPDDPGSRPRRLAVIGGGLAGLAAAAEAIQRGWQVELFEQAGSLGGRASSIAAPDSGGAAGFSGRGLAPFAAQQPEGCFAQMVPVPLSLPENPAAPASVRLVDLCPHVAMGCCTEWLDLICQARLTDRLTRHRTLHFYGPEGTRHDFTATRLLPAPFHLLPGLLRLSYLTWAERWSISRALLRLRKKWAYPFIADGATAGDWLRREGQSDRAIERFWSVVLESALAETVDHASLPAARQVFVEGFLTSSTAYELVVPRCPLGQLWQELGTWLASQGVTVRLGCRVERIEGDGRHAESLVLADGTRCVPDAVVVAVPWWRVRGLLAPALLAAMPELSAVDQIPSAAITAVQLEFDRPITSLPHAVLVGRLSQWVFAGPVPGHYQVVISATHRLPARSRKEPGDEVLGDLQAIWPAARAARLLARRVQNYPRAVFSMQPGVEQLRPPQATSIKNLALAGDWTATGWPGTMEGAVRSGRRAVAATEDTEDTEN